MRVQAEGAAGGAEAEARRQAQREEAAAREAAVAAAAREEAAKREAERKKAVQVRWFLLTPVGGLLMRSSCSAMLCMLCMSFAAAPNQPVAAWGGRFGLLVYPLCSGPGTAWRSVGPHVGRCMMRAPSGKRCLSPRHQKPLPQSCSRTCRWANLSVLIETHMI